MVSLSVLVLGSDPVGRMLARRLNGDHPGARVGMMGRAATDAQLEVLRRESDRILPNPTSDGIPNAALPRDLAWIGPPPFALTARREGFLVRGARDNEPVEPVHARELVVTAPPMLDLMESGLDWPGTDSAVTGLVAEACGIPPVPSTELRWRNVEGTRRIRDLDFGLECDERGNPGRTGVHVAGMAGAGPADSVDPEALLDRLDPRDPPAADGFETPEPTQEDLAMPEGFVDTKTDRLRELISRAVRTDNPSENLIPALEGLAGEIDSYARFRREPRLQRLHGKARTAMNFVRPFLVDRREAAP